MSEFYNAVRRRDEGQAVSLPHQGATAKLHQIRSVRSRASLYYEGDLRDYAFEILCGTARLVRRTAGGQRLILDFKSAGDVVGICAGPFYDHAAEMITPGKIRAVRYENTRQMDLPGRLHNKGVRDFFADDLAHTRDHLLILALKNPRERVALFLTEMARRRQFRAASAEKDVVVLHLPMPRRDIADYLGLTPETICRTFAQFRKSGIICSPSCSTVHILNWAWLVNCAGNPSDTRGSA